LFQRFVQLKEYVRKLSENEFNWMLKHKVQKTIKSVIIEVVQETTPFDAIKQFIRCVNQQNL